MTVSVRQFRAQFPEFRNTATAVIERGLADAALMIGAIWGDKADIGQKYLAADLIASGPLGEKARLKKDDTMTTYRAKYNSIKASVTVGFRNT